MAMNYIRTSPSHPAQWAIETPEGSWYARYQNGMFSLYRPDEAIWGDGQFLLDIRESEAGQMTDDTLRLLLAALNSIDPTVPTI